MNILRVGDHVRMPEKVWNEWQGKLLRPSRTGTVTGFPLDHFVRVQLDGSEYSTTWHLDCWQFADF
jgi:hypothetical protein